MMQRTLLTFAALLLLGCPTPSPTGPSDGGSLAPDTPSAGSQTSPPPSNASSAPGSNTAAAKAPTMAGDAARWVGNWSSASCGKRKYVRTINLGADGSFSAQDLVSPCVSPPGGPPINCVWSGIVNYSGSWANEGDKLTLKSDKNDGPKALTVADGLSWNAGRNAPTELGAPECVYEKAGAAPATAGKP